MRQLTDDAQVVTDEYSFDGWGKLTSSTGSTANSQLYKGEYLAYRKDPDAGLSGLLVMVAILTGPTVPMARAI